MPDTPPDAADHLLAVTVVGVDRPGIVAEVTTALAGVAGNLEDSTMTLLRGRFAMVLLVRGRADAGQVEAALAAVAADGTLLVDVGEVGSAAAPVAGPSTHLLHVHGADRPGIVAELTGVLAAAGANLVDLSTRLSGELYVLTAEVVLPATVEEAALARTVGEAAERIGVRARLVEVETDRM